MYKKIFQKITFILVLFNAFICSLCLIGKQFLLDHHTDPNVVIGANILLFLLSFIVVYMHYRAAQNKNPNAFIRSILMATLLKLVVVAGAVFLYLFLAGPLRNVYAIFVSMVLYVVYTVIEVRGGYKINAIRN